MLPAEAVPSILSESSPPIATKAALRQQMRQRRIAASKGDDGTAAGALSALVRTRILQHRLRPGVVGGYWPVGSEMDCRPLLGELAAAGWDCALPVVDGLDLPLVFRRWHPGCVLVPGRFGIPQPPDSHDIVVPEVLLVPLLAFDRRGHRLGQGAGCYDRTLSALRQRGGVQAIGLGFAVQEVPRLPVEPHDQRLHWIVTEAAAYQISQR